jgi:hypothetical protein
MIRLRDTQGRLWTVEGDWDAETVGADFDGRGQILAWIRPTSQDAHLEPLVTEGALGQPEQAAAPLPAVPPRALPAAEEA